MSKILIVEDDKNIAMSLCVRLKAGGHEVSMAHDSTIGMDKALHDQPDLIILDIMMPAGGGLWMAGNLRDLETSGHTPILFITASREPGLREKAARIENSSFFEKPYDGDVLMAAIAKLTDH